MDPVVAENSYAGTFFQRLAEAKSRVLLLDYEGTIAPFSANRRPAFPYPGVCGFLNVIGTRCNTRVIVVSGRPAYELPPLLRLDPQPEIWGNHGLERMFPDGRYEYEEIQATGEVLFALADAEAALKRAGHGDLTEIKLSGISVHWGGLKAAEILEIRTSAYRILEPLAATHACLVLSDFEQGVELRLRTANKGSAVQKLMTQLPSHFPIAYLGDDCTDEEVFRTLNGRGLTVLVRSVPRFTAAQICLRPPTDLTQFLKNWILASGGDC